MLISQMNDKTRIGGFTIMKKMLYLLLTLVMCLSLVACGGPDRQPAIDEFNEASTAFDALVEIINKDIEAYPQEVIDLMVEMSEALTLHKETLESDEELTEEKLNEMIEWYNVVDQWVIDLKKDLNIK